MAKTNKYNIYYSGEEIYPQTADVPAEIKKVAESIEESLSENLAKPLDNIERSLKETEQKISQNANDIFTIQENIENTKDDFAILDETVDEHSKEIDKINSKLQDIEIGAGSTISIDSELSETSENPVQNKAITKVINNMKSLLDLKNILPKNAGVHNSIYRGKDITELWYDGTLSEQISNQTFDDIFIGDYIIGKTSGIKYLVADINYRLNTGSVMCTIPHVLMITEKCIGTTSMNTTNSVEGAYYNSRLRSMFDIDVVENPDIDKIINDFVINDLETSHILRHKNYFCNAVTENYESNGNWYDSTIDLMNECMVYGSNIYHNFRNGNSKAMNITIDKSQLAIFRHRPDLITALNNSGAIQKYWLRDVASESTFCLVGGGGSANNAGASEVQGIRPAFLIY